MQLYAFMPFPSNWQTYSLLKDSVQTELKALYPNIPIVFSEKVRAAWNGNKVGFLLYAETTDGYRIASTAEFEAPEPELNNYVHTVKNYGIETVQKLRLELRHKGVVDEHLADQLVIFMALATSTAARLEWEKENLSQQKCTISTGPLTSHTITAIRLSEAMLGDINFTIRPRCGRGFIVTCERKLSDKLKIFNEY